MCCAEQTVYVSIGFDSVTAAARAHLRPDEVSPMPEVSQPTRESDATLDLLRPGLVALMWPGATAPDRRDATSRATTDRLLAPGLIDDF